jgi:hypothetical protein
MRADTQPEKKRTRNTASLILALVLCTCGYFSNAGSWNQSARLNPIYSFVEPGPEQYTFHFNRFMPKPEKNITTGDWSYYRGNYYSNKAPGTTWAGIPVYAALYTLQTSGGLDVDNPHVAFANIYLINLTVSVLPIACAALALYQLFINCQKTSRDAALLAVVFALSTLLLPYSTQLWGHTTAASCIALSLFRLANGTRSDSRWGGIYAGLAVCFDYLAVVPLLGIILWTLITQRKLFFSFISGGILPAILLGTYHWICFGSPFSMPTDFTNPQFLEKDRVFGLFGSSSAEILWQLSFGPMRGIFLTMPILLLSLFGIGVGLRKNSKDSLSWCCLLVVLGSFLLNSSFNGWHAGASVGARYQIVALPFWILPLTNLLPARRVLVGLFGLVSFVGMFATAAVGPIAPDVGQPPQPNPSPLFEWVLPNFFKGKLGQFIYPARLQGYHPDIRQFIEDSSWNVGNMLGLPDPYSLLPLFLIIVVLGVLLYRSTRTPEAR